MKKLGVIVNPIAGIGGKVGLKGSDGSETLAKALSLGAAPESPRRAIDALRVLSRISQKIEVVTYPAEMGEQECLEAGFEPEVIGTITSGQTTAQDTQNAARDLAAAGADLILFAGGDGTARNVYASIGNGLPVLGIPAGVKIHSAVYAVTPRSAGEVASLFLEGRLNSTRDAEVMDIDEEAFRQGIVSAKLYGYLVVPEEKRFIQNVKSGGIVVEKAALHGIAQDVISSMDENTYYIIGPGTTTRTIMERLGLQNTLLGVDLIKNKELIANDVTEEQLFNAVKANETRIVVTAIGGQGHVFGRGNQQISPRIIRRTGRGNIIIIATKEKIISLSDRPLLVDTGDEELDEKLGGYIRVTTGFREYIIYRLGY